MRQAKNDFLKDVESTVDETEIIIDSLSCTVYLQSNFYSSNIFGAMDICSRYVQFESLRVNHHRR